MASYTQGNCSIHSDSYRADLMEGSSKMPQESSNSRKYILSRFMFPSLTVLMSLTLNSISYASANIGNPANNLEWTCIDHTHWKNGKQDPGVIENSKFATLQFKNTKLTNNVSQSTISFDSVRVEITKGKFKEFHFVLAIGHTALIGKTYKVRGDSFTQVLNLKYTIPKNKVSKLELNSSFTPVGKIGSASNMYFNCQPTSRWNFMLEHLPQHIIDGPISETESAETLVK